jgi:endoglucanase Acf2
MKMPEFSIRCLFALSAASLLSAPIRAQDVVAAGAGTYTTKLPAGAKEPAETPFITSNVKGPVPTNDWWSSLVFQKFSNQMFPHPLGIQAHTDGLRIYYPGTGYTANKEGVFTAIMGAPNDITIGHSANAKFPDARVDNWSDWFVTACFGDASATSTANLKLTFGHGSPFVYGRIRGGNPTFTFANAVTPVPVSGHPGAVTVQIANRTYGLYAPAGAKWEGAGTKVLTASSSKDYFSVALLPDRSAETIARFAAVAHNHVTDSKVVWQYNEAKSVVTSRYAITTKPMQGTGTKTLYCLLPHQVLRSKETLTGQSYQTSRGEIQLAEGNEIGRASCRERVSTWV